MTHINQAIREAVKGGYDRSRALSSEGLEEQSYLFLDPLFWQGLGKARGWKPVTWPNTNHPKELHYRLEGWHWQMHRFIDHLAEGKDSESFFANLT